MHHLASEMQALLAAVPARSQVTSARRAVLNFSMHWTLGCRARAILLRAVGLSLPRDGKISRGTRLGGTTIRFGQGFGANEECWIDNFVAIGDRVRIGARVTIITQTHPIGDGEQRRGWEDVTRPVAIGHGAWLQTGCTVLPGAHIADGCVILAGAVVTKPTKPHGEYAGIPAVRVRDLPASERPASGRVVPISGGQQQLAVG